MKRQKEKTYLVIGQDTTDGEMVIKTMTAEQIRKLEIHKTPDYCIVNGQLIKSFNGTWNLK
jgi:hypothetical protein